MKGDTPEKKVESVKRGLECTGGLVQQGGEILE